MKTKITNYTFDKTAKTVTFTDYTSIRLDGILLVVNVTSGIIIYNFADTTKLGTVSTNVLTLAFDTSAQANTDKLLIYYDDTTVPMVTSGKMVTSTTTFTRPAGALGYAANQSVNTNATTGTIITFPSMSRVSSGTGYIVRATLFTDQSSSAAQMRLHLFSTATPTIPPDGAAFALKYADRANYLGFNDFNALQTEGSGSDVAVAVDAAIRHAFIADSSSNVYGLLEAKSAFSASASQNFGISFLVEQN